MRTPETPALAGGRDPDAGDTLIEILISVAIVGIVSVALLAGFLTSITSSTIFRAVANADTVLRTAVDSVTTQMQQDPTDAFNCPADASVYQVSGLPAGYSSQATQVQYWVGGAGQTTCAADAPQLITLAVTYTTARSTSTNHATFLVDDPQSAPVQVGAVASKLVFLASGGPSNTTAGSAIPEQPLVAIEDSAGKIVTTDLSPVSLSITPNSGSPGAQLANCTGSEFYGVVNFSGCEIDVAGSGYTLTATDSGLTSATSSTFTVNPGPATNLIFSQSPVNQAGNQAGTGGTAFLQQPVVTLRDAFGNTATEDTSTVTIAITSGTGTAGASLTCTPSNDQHAVSAGVAAFTGCAIDKAGSGYTLAATDGTLTSATSIAFTIVHGSADKLVFTTEPGGTITGGVAFPSQPVVTVEDAGGNTVTSDSSTVTLQITSNTGTPGASLTCAPSNDEQAASAGVATFSGCAVDKAGSGYTLTATDGTLTSGFSTAFSVSVGPAAKLGFTTQPGGTFTAGVAFPTQPVVTVEDAGGNPETSNGSTVTLGITSGTGTAGASLTCTPSNNQQAASAGVATFSGCAINKAGSGYTLTASDGSLTAAVSTTFSVGPATATKLVFTTQPGGAITHGVAFPTQPVVTIEDAYGDTVTTNTSTVTLAITPNSGTTGASLACSPSNDQKAASAGVATFSGCAINDGGLGYTLTATDGGLTAAISTAFNVVGPATQLVFTTQPAGATKGKAFTTQPVVTVEDAYGNTVTTDSSNVTLAITTGTGSGTFSCTTNPLPASGGIAAFQGCKIKLASGNGYQLTATDGSLKSANSSPFNVAS
jgi:trimeric autotransporter adhesin